MIALYREGVQKAKGGFVDEPRSPTQTNTPHKALDRAAQIATAGVAISGLARDAAGPKELESLSLAQVGLLLPLVSALGELGSLVDIPQDVNEDLIALLSDFQAKAPALAESLKQRLSTGNGYAQATHSKVQLEHRIGLR